jgi:hypothetical protein
VSFNSTGTLCKNSGNGSFADFLAAISVNFIDSGTRQNWPRFWQYSQSGLIRPDQTQSDLIGSQFWGCSRSKTTMPKKGALLLRHACPDEPDNGKYEY